MHIKIIVQSEVTYVVCVLKQELEATYQCFNYFLTRSVESHSCLISFNILSTYNYLIHTLTEH